MKNTTLEALLAAYLKNWGRISWRSLLSQSNPKPNSHVSGMLTMLSGIEKSTSSVYDSLRLASGDYYIEVHEFYIMWLAEESDHGRALQYAANLMGDCKANYSIRKHSNIREFFYNLTVRIISRFAIEKIQGTYLLFGCNQEYIAMVVYQYLSNKVEDENLSKVLTEIAAEEIRHMRFFRCAAKHLFQQDDLSITIAKYLLPLIWQPPGVDLYGIEKWKNCFGNLLNDNIYCNRLLKIDNIVAEILGTDIMLMKKFIADNKFPGKISDSHIDVINYTTSK